jgi:hypothetical protein
MRGLALILVFAEAVCWAAETSVVRVEGVSLSNSTAVVRDLQRRRRVRVVLPASALQIQPGDVVRMTWELIPGSSAIRCLRLEKSGESATESQRRRAHNRMGNWDLRKKEPE